MRRYTSVQSAKIYSDIKDFLFSTRYKATGNCWSTKQPCWQLCQTMAVLYRLLNATINMLKCSQRQCSCFPHSPSASFTGKMANLEKWRDDKVFSVHPLGKMNICTSVLLCNDCSSKSCFPHTHYMHTRAHRDHQHMRFGLIHLT